MNLTEEFSSTGVLRGGVGTFSEQPAALGRDGGDSGAKLLPAVRPRHPRGARVRRSGNA